MFPHSVAGQTFSAKEVCSQDSFQLRRGRSKHLQIAQKEDWRKKQNINSPAVIVSSVAQTWLFEP
jgi:hypothetical protein